MATLAMVMNHIQRSVYGESKNIGQDSQAFDKMYNNQRQMVLCSGTLRDPMARYIVWAQIAYNTIPFYKYYFKFYRPNQKLLVLRFLQRHQVFNEGLFSDFTQWFFHSVRQTKEKDFEQAIAKMCQSQDPLTNERLDHFDDLLTVLDFYLKNQLSAAKREPAPD